MTSRSMTKRLGVPTTEVRWRVPVEIRHDMEMYARRLGLNTGELMMIACIRLLATLHERVNAEMDTKLPPPTSLRFAGKGFAVKDIMEGLREMPR